MQEKLAYGCRKSRASDAGKTGLLMQQKRVSRCSKNWSAAAGKAEMLPWWPWRAGS
jgi:hypothetical protein